MSNLVPLAIGRPAHLKPIQLVADAAALCTGLSSGFPVLSIKGSKWRLTKGDEATPIIHPQTGDQATSIQVVILKASPNLSKIYYSQAYTDGVDASPDCYSNDGVAPAGDVKAPVHATCAGCPKNVFGSKITPSGSKTKACADSRRVAVALAGVFAENGVLSDPILLRVPVMSLQNLSSYGRSLITQQAGPSQVVTKLGFDANASYPRITFQAISWISSEMAAAVDSLVNDPMIAAILGTAEPAPSFNSSGEVVATTTAPATAAPLVAATATPEAERVIADILANLSA